MAEIRVPNMLRPAVGGERSVSGTGTTLRALLDDVGARHPDLLPRLFDPDTGELRRFVNMYVNDEDVRYLDGLNTKVAEGDVISILPAVAGGF